MKYFTPQLFLRLQDCPDQEAFRAVNAEWEEAVRQYGAQLEEMTPRLPPELRHLVKWGSLHDARVLEIGTAPRRLTLVLLDERCSRLVSLSYSLVDAPMIDRTALSPEHQSMPVQWLYDEIERDTEMLYNARLRIQDRASALVGAGTGEDGWRPIYLHSILLSNGWEIRLRFHRLNATRTTCLLHAAEEGSRPEASLSLP